MSGTDGFERFEERRDLDRQASCEGFDRASDTKVPEPSRGDVPATDEFERPFKGVRRDPKLTPGSSYGGKVWWPTERRVTIWLVLSLIVLFDVAGLAVLYMAVVQADGTLAMAALTEVGTAMGAALYLLKQLLRGS